MKYLVLASGLTGSGKSWASKYMKGQLGFYRVCPEEIRDSFYGTKHMSDPEERAVANANTTDMALGEVETAFRVGRNVVIDSGAPSNKRRHELLGGFKSEDLEKYLLIFEASPETRIERILKRPGYGQRLLPDEVKVIVYNDMLGWEEPDLLEGVEVIRYRKETIGDLEKIKRDLERRFLV
jgi:predicted kinase